MPRVSILISAIATAAAIGGLTYLVLPGDEIAAPAASTQASSTTTVAHNWQWGNFGDTKPGEASKADQPSAKETPYDPMEVYKVLQRIKVDEYGRVVPDQTAMQALEKGFTDLGPNLTQDDIRGLQDVIRKGLPGPAGEDAARLFEDYYRYRLAEMELGDQLVNQVSAPDHYEKLVQLRRQYLSDEVADKLFAVQDAQARHMLAADAIEKNAELSREQKQAQQAALRDKLDSQLLSLGQLKPEEAAAERVQRLREQGASSAEINSARESLLGSERARELAAADREESEWQSNFNGFWQARRYVVQAGLDDAERDRRVEQLLEQYFSPEERERARATSSEWLARDAN